MKLRVQNEITTLVSLFGTRHTPGMSFAGQVCVVTGASSGIGKAIALQLASSGARLLLAARSGDELEQAARECREAGGEAAWVAADVSVEADCRRIVDEALKTYGAIDMLVNNAGITMRARFDQITDLSLFERIMRVNYLGSVYCTAYALPHLKMRKGRIVAIASLTGKTGVPMRSAYAASKHAMAGFFDSLRIELAPSGVSVTVIYPGFVTSDIRRRALGPDAQPLAGYAGSEEGDMSAEECARIAIAAAERRKREVVLTAQGKAGVLLKALAPSLVDRIARRVMENRKR
jgi:short-subunit dehydrogenase